jgi:DNA-binding response OmpR family regulator
MRESQVMRLLVVEDDEMLSRALRRGLEADGYSVEVTGDGLEAVWMATENCYDAIILDILLPGMSGYKVCHQLRAQDVHTPVLMLTAKSGSWDETEGLDTGADDYMVKPFHYPVLLARLRALLRRGPARHAPVLMHGSLQLDTARHCCHLATSEIDLTPKEFALLRYLLSHPDVTHTKQDLLNHVWGETDSADLNVVQVYVSALRRKIDRPGRPSFLKTVRGIGYQLAP